MKALLRARAYYSLHELVSQYKCQVLGILELNLGGFYHAASSILCKLDAVQDSFLREHSEEIEDLAAHAPVEAGRGFIQEQHLGVAQ